MGVRSAHTNGKCVFKQWRTNLKHNKKRKRKQKYKRELL